MSVGFVALAALLLVGGCCFYRSRIRRPKASGKVEDSGAVEEGDLEDYVDSPGFGSTFGKAPAIKKPARLPDKTVASPVNLKSEADIFKFANSIQGIGEENDVAGKAPGSSRRPSRMQERAAAFEAEAAAKEAKMTFKERKAQAVARSSSRPSTPTKGRSAAL